MTAKHARKRNLLSHPHPSSSTSKAKGIWISFSHSKLSNPQAFLFLFVSILSLFPLHAQVKPRASFSISSSSTTSFSLHLFFPLSSDNDRRFGEVGFNICEVFRSEFSHGGFLAKFDSGWLFQASLQSVRLGPLIFDLCKEFSLGLTPCIALGLVFFFLLSF